MKIKTRQYLWLFLLIILASLAYSLKNIEAIQQINIKISSLIFNSSNQNRFWINISHLADTYALIFYIILASASFIYQKKYRHILLLLFFQAMAQVIKYVVNLIVLHERPEFSIVSCQNPFNTPSFPSGHTFSIFVFFGFMYLLSQGKVKKVFLVLSIIIPLLVAYSRIYIGCHWFFDIIGSFLSGLFVLEIAWILKRKWIIK